MSVAVPPAFLRRTVMGGLVKNVNHSLSGLTSEQAGNQQQGNSHLVPLGHRTLGMECKGVLSTGVDKMLIGSRVDVGLTSTTLMVMSPCGGDWPSWA